MKLRIVAVLLVVVAIAIPLAVYAAYYTGDRKVTVSFDVELVAVGEVCVSGLEVDSEPMGLFSWYDTLRGHSPSRVDLYSVYASLNQSGEVETMGEGCTLLVGEPEEFRFVFYDMQPGESVLRIYVKYGYADAVIYDYEWTVHIT